MSWDQLISIRKEQRQIAEDERTAPLVDCPFCGILLNVRDGQYDCALGHFRTRNPFRHQTAVRG